MLSQAAYTLLQKSVHEEGLAFPDYARLAAADIGKALALFLARQQGTLVQGSFEFPDTGTLPSWVDRVIAQRLLIDRAEYDASLLLYRRLLSDFEVIPSDVQGWVLYFGAKALQHQGSTAEASYLLSELRKRRLPEVLSLYVRLDEAYLLCQMNQNERAQPTLDLLCEQLERLAPGVSRDKVATSAGQLLWSVGDLRRAQDLLRSVSETGQDALYVERARLYLFQIQVECGNVSAAAEGLEFLRTAFASSARVDRASFLRSWMKLAALQGDPDTAARLQRECVATPDYSQWLSYRVNVFCDAPGTPDLSRALSLARECRQADDAVSRAYLWLELLRSQALVLPRGRALKMLASIEAVFTMHSMTSEMLRTQALRLSLEKKAVTREWLDRCFALGHLYLMGSQSLAADLERNSVYLSSGRRVDLGKDRFTVSLLKVLAGARSLATPEACLSVYGDEQVNEHVVKKLQVAVNRMNTRLGVKVVHADSRDVRLLGWNALITG